MLAKVLSLLLLLQLTLADDLPIELPAYLKSISRVSVLKKQSAVNFGDELKSIITVSWNKPTMATYRERLGDPNYKGEAIIQQLDSKGHKKKDCVLPAISYVYTELETYLYSMENNIEILVITKRFDNEDPSTDIFVVNMNDCSYTTQVLPIDFSDIPERGQGYIVLRPWQNDQFDIFTFADKNTCGSYICKRIFDIKNNLIKKPTKFLWLNDGIPKASPSWDLYGLLAINADRYIGILSQGTTKVKIDYLTERGADIKSFESYINFFKNLKLKCSFDEIGLCYSMSQEIEQMSCMLIDAKQDMRKKFNFSAELGFNPQEFALWTNPDSSGIILLTLGCPKSQPPESTCDRYKLQLNQMMPDQTMKVLQSFNPDASCQSKSEFGLTLYEEDEQMCMYYGCKIPPQKGQPDRTILSKCFDKPKL